MSDWNGFDKGVIGRKLPSDSTLNQMKKAELIELLHIAEHNHEVLAETYKIAIDTSKCNTCPLSLDTKKARADAIEECEKKFNELENTDCPDGCYCIDNQDCCPYLECLHDVKKILKQLKEQK